VTLASLTGIGDATERPALHDDEMFALFVVALLGAGRAPGDGLAPLLAHVLKA
jgi:hypothetical protein